MEIESTITVHCGNLSARDMIPIRSLASAMGADISPFAGQDPSLIRVELRATIGKEIVVSNCDTTRLELEAVQIPAFAEYIRDHLVGQLGDLVREKVLESLTPPPPYVETGALFIDQPIFLKSTGNRQRDRVLAEQFSKTAEAISILHKNNMI